MSPGSGLWLLRHELRLGWRDLGRHRWILLLVALLLWTLLHWGVAKLLGRGMDLGHPLLNALRLQLAGLVFWTLCSVLLAQTMAHAVIALFDRADLDLLLASPLDPRRVLLLRGLGIMVGALALPAFLLLPVAHVGLWQGHAFLLALYPLVLASGLLCAGIGIWLTMVLARAFGARRARVIAQILAALIGAAVLLLSQLHALLPDSTRNALLGWLLRQVGPGGWMAADSWLWWPARAARGELLPLLSFVLLGAGVFTLAIALTWRSFLHGSQELVAAAAPRATGRTRANFTRRPWQVLLLKEWKLLLRDPHIISQTLLQLLYLCPLLLVALHRPQAAQLLLPALVLIGGMLAGNLAWLTVCAEDAPDLLAAAPQPRWKLRLFKALAAVLPPQLLLLPLLLYWLPTQPLQALVLLLCSWGAMLAASLIHLGNPVRGDRRDLRKRYKQNRLGSQLEILAMMGWAAMALVLLGGHWGWLLPALATATLPVLGAWLLGRRARREGND